MHKLKFIEFKSDKGAVLIIFAIFLSSGLMLALLMLVVDGGSIFNERRVVQNAADQSAMALAQECAVDGNGGISAVSPSYPSPVCSNQLNAKNFTQFYASANSPDLLTSVLRVCGKFPLDPCPSQSDVLYECKDVNPKYKSYVRVETTTSTSKGDFLDLLFSPFVNSVQSVSIPGCTNVAWGKADKAPIFFPFALPICDFPLSLPADRVILDYQSTKNCSITDLEGVNFNFTGVPDGSFVLTEYRNLLGQFVEFGCPNVNNSVTLKVGSLVRVESSLQQVEQACSRIGLNFRQIASNFLNKSVFLPIITNVTCNSNTTNCGNFTAPVATFASFRIKGLILKGGNQNLIGDNPPTGWPTNCTSNSKIQVCLYGQFVKSIVPGAGISTDPSFPAVGAQAIQMLP